MAWEPGPFLPLVKEPAATDAAEELAGIDRLGELLVWGDRSRFHLGQRTRVLRHHHQATLVDGQITKPYTGPCSCRV